MQYPLYLCYRVPLKTLGNGALAHDENMLKFQHDCNNFGLAIGTSDWDT